MSQFDELLAALEKEDYSGKRQLMELITQMVRKIRKLEPLDRDALSRFAFSQIDVLLKAIPNAETYREKDLIMEYEDLLLGLIMALFPTSGDVPGDVLGKMQILVKLVEQQRHLEIEIERVLEQKTIEPRDITHLCYLARNISDEYQKGRLYAGLVHYQNVVRSLSEQAKAPLKELLVREAERYLALEERMQDHWENLEMIADIARYFMDDKMSSLLCRMTELEHKPTRFFAAESLVICNRQVPDGVIDSLARDLVYANSLYHTLTGQGKQHLFPKELTSEEYLAKSDLVHWLTYPTELGKEPDEIQYIGKVTYLFRKEVYHVFRFRSDSDTLGDDMKNKWLIGWSGTDGGTFSNFDLYEQYKKQTTAATLKYIKKKLIG